MSHYLLLLIIKKRFIICVDHQLNATRISSPSVCTYVRRATYYCLSINTSIEVATELEMNSGGNTF